MPKKRNEPIPESTIQVRVLFINEGGVWVAQCLEHDIAAQGRTLDEAEAAWERTFIGQVMLDAHSGKDPLADIKPAPGIYWRRFSQEGRRVSADPIELPKDTPPAFMIEKIQRENRVA